MTSFFSSKRRSRVLAFGAHPDDIEVGAGGLIARLCRGGAEVVMAVVCVPTLREQRLKEAAEGSRILGARLMVLFEDAMSRVEDVPMHELVRRFDHVVADARPDLVITHSASDLHWDHGLVNRATISALRRTQCDLLAFTSSYELNAHSRGIGECFADVTATMEQKLDAVRAHGSQLPKFDLESTRDLARAMGRISGVAYAEAFEVLRIRI
jgi:LmbE family N-acetylglucosaminyl deacetylase